MTKTEAKKVFNAALEADGGCDYCARSVLVELAIDFPEIDWKGIYEKKQKCEWETFDEDVEYANRLRNV
jgi:hypothetical protein